MVRGNRREPIVFNDSDREMFDETLWEVATKAGFAVFAWVLLDNHYHAVLRTPHGNLVEFEKNFPVACDQLIELVKPDGGLAVLAKALA